MIYYKTKKDTFVLPPARHHRSQSGFRDFSYIARVLPHPEMDLFSLVRHNVII